MPPPTLDSPPFCIGGQDTCDVRLRQPGEPEARYRHQCAPLPGLAVNLSR